MAGAELSVGAAGGFQVCGLVLMSLVRAGAGLILSADPRGLRNPVTFACMQQQVRRDLKLCATQLEPTTGTAPDRLAEVEGPAVDGEVWVVQFGDCAVFVEPRLRRFRHSVAVVAVVQQLTCDVAQLVGA